MRGRRGWRGRCKAFIVLINYSAVAFSMHDKVITICKRHCCPNCANKSKIIFKMQNWKTFRCFGWIEMYDNACGWVCQKLLQSQPAAVENFDKAQTPKGRQWCPKYWHCLSACLVCPSSLPTMALCKWTQIDKCVCVCVQRDSLYNLFTDCHQFWVKLRISSQMSNWLTDDWLGPCQHAAKIDDVTRLRVYF